ncbi:hypothetical protein ARMSODRAFT_982985 [Armillaria solidipes]|uniref:Uncharacterized protein n=1 Tax=Armillaria solidipes TaxID=1076256 RepID=A0A2H3B8X4_9AGAR|nr:hypothetical protein ARMSODRAFT_982985 [Armillaria solidipes]
MIGLLLRFTARPRMDNREGKSLGDAEFHLGRHGIAKLTSHKFFANIRCINLHDETVPADIHVPQFIQMGIPMLTLEDNGLDGNGSEPEPVSDREVLKHHIDRWRQCREDSAGEWSETTHLDLHWQTRCSQPCSMRSDRLSTKVVTPVYRVKHMGLLLYVCHSDGRQKTLAKMTHYTE